MVPKKFLQTKYLNLCGLDKLKYDDWQYNLLSKFDELLEQLEQKAQAPQPSFVSKIFKKAPPPILIRGYYIYGHVGRGKTMLMDMLFEQAPEPKLRAHFNDFMQECQARLNFWRSQIINGNSKIDDEVELLANEMAKKAQLLCFDEFTVTDIADAMLLYRLFKKLFDKGVTLVATSNVAPQDLYKNGLNRALFEPFIPLLQQHCIVINSGGKQDYRTGLETLEQHYLYPIDDENNETLENNWCLCTSGCLGSPREIDVLGHKLYLRQCCDRVLRLSFEELCNRALGVNDYNAIAKNFDIIFITDIPVLVDETRNQAKRFILAIDIFYEAKTKLYITAHAPAQELYQGQAETTEKHEFLRTASRLLEMQSVAYNHPPKN